MVVVLFLCVSTSAIRCLACFHDTKRAHDPGGSPGA